MPLELQLESLVKRYRRHFGHWPEVSGGSLEDVVAELRRRLGERDRPEPPSGGAATLRAA